MYSIANMFERRRRLCSAVLLLILLAAAVGHALLPAGHAHPAHESNCPVHAGMLITGQPQASVQAAACQVRSVSGDAPALDLAAKIPHPPIA